MPRAEDLASRGLDPDRATALDQNTPRLAQQPDLAAALAHGGFKCARHRSAAATRHLRLGGARQQRGDVMPEPAHAQVNLAQAVEEQEPGLDGRMFKFLMHELERGQRAHLHQVPAGSGSLKPGRAFFGWKRRRAALGDQDVAHDRHEVGVPAAQSFRVAFAEGLERRDRALDVGPPFERAAIAGDERDVELRLDVLRAVPFKLEVRVPGHRRDGALEERVGVVQESRVARVFQGGEPTARHRLALKRECLEPGLAQVGLQDQPVVAGTEDDPVVSIAHAYHHVVMPALCRASTFVFACRVQRRGWPGQARP